MTHEALVFDRHSFADERVRRDLATLADARILLYLDKRTDLRVRADRTAVKIDQIRLKDPGAWT